MNAYTRRRLGRYAAGLSACAPRLPWRAGTVHAEQSGAVAAYAAGDDPRLSVVDGQLHVSYLAGGEVWVRPVDAESGNTGPERRLTSTDGRLAGHAVAFHGSGVFLVATDPVAGTLYLAKLDAAWNAVRRATIPVGNRPAGPFLPQPVVTYSPECLYIGLIPDAADTADTPPSGHSGAGISFRHFSADLRETHAWHIAGDYTGGASLTFADDSLVLLTAAPATDANAGGLRLTRFDARSGRETDLLETKALIPDAASDDLSTAVVGGADHSFDGAAFSVAYVAAAQPAGGGPPSPSIRLATYDRAWATHAEGRSIPIEPAAAASVGPRVLRHDGRTVLTFAADRTVYGGAVA